MFWMYVFLKIVSPVELNTTSRILPMVNTRAQTSSEVCNLQAIGIQDGLYRISSPYRQLLWGLHTVHFDYTL